jgi:hypothetical protein
MVTYTGRGRKLDLIAVLPALKATGLGRQTTTLMEQKAVSAVQTERIGGGFIQNYYYAVWGGQCPPDIKAPLVDYYGSCARCEGPMFDSYTGRSGAEYCGENCAYDATDPDDWEDDYHEDPEPEEEFEATLTPEEQSYLEQLGDDIPGMDTEPGWGV